jgi:hypothetical protein
LYFIIIIITIAFIRSALEDKQMEEDVMEVENCEIFLTAGVCEKLSNLVLQLPVQQKVAVRIWHSTPSYTAFMSVRTVAKNFPLALSCPSVHMLQRGTHWTDFREICYLRLLLKSVDKIQICLKSNVKISHLACRPKRILLLLAT